jgi:hypothetical protein
VSSKLGRPSGRPNSRSASVGHPGASPEKGEPVFSSSPRAPLLHNGVWVRWPIDADAPWKSHGRLRGTARTNPSTALPPSFEKRRNACRFSTAPTGRRRSVEGRSLGLSLHSEPSAWLGDSTKARLHSTLFQPSGCPNRWGPPHGSASRIVSTAVARIGGIARRPIAGSWVARCNHAAGA